MARRVAHHCCCRRRDRSGCDLPVCVSRSAGATDRCGILSRRLCRGLVTSSRVAAIASMRRIFLTGASSGIGLATAEALLTTGDEVWGTSRNPADLLKHDRFHPVRLDLHNDTDIDQAFTCALTEAGHFDVVINNAGSGHFGPAELLSLPEIREQFQVVFFAHVRLMQ